ncbi:MAG: peptidoglycan-binding protein [Acidobacteria bacterium]|nr:peptidoglycan-binding protein [Acidobacteriota bacterium]
MLSSRAGLAFLLAAAVAVIPAFATPTHKKSSTPHARTAKTSAHSSKTSAKSRKGSKKSRRTKLRGQQGIDSARATEIQQALIREHYLNGEPTGAWDSATVAAMQKFQRDQGWQSHLTPDSRALKKLGLGPDYSNAINASGSSFADPKPAAELPASQSAGFAAASGVNR